MATDDLGDGVDVGLSGPAGFDVEAGGLPEETGAACVCRGGCRGGCFWWVYLGFSRG